MTVKRALIIFLLALWTLIAMTIGYFIRFTEVELWRPYQQRMDEKNISDLLLEIPPADNAWERDVRQVVKDVNCKFGGEITRISGIYGYNPKIVTAVVAIESRGNPRAISKSGAEGLMQLMPPTARAVGVSNTFDPRENIIGGIKYLLRLHNHFGFKELPDKLVAYNRGTKAAPVYLEKNSAKKDLYVRRFASSMRIILE